MFCFFYNPSIPQSFHALASNYQALARKTKFHDHLHFFLSF